METECSMMMKDASSALMKEMLVCVAAKCRWNPGNWYRDLLGRRRFCGCIISCWCVLCMQYPTTLETIDKTQSWCNSAGKAASLEMRNRWCWDPSLDWESSFFKPAPAVPSCTFCLLHFETIGTVKKISTTQGEGGKKQRFCMHFNSLYQLVH